MENTTDRRGTCPYVSPSRKEACVNNLLFSKIFGWLNMVNSGISSGSLFVGEFAGFCLFFLQHVIQEKNFFLHEDVPPWSMLSIVAVASSNTRRNFT